MKTLCITIFDGAISKNILRTDVFPMLAKQYRIVLFVPPGKVSYYRERFASSTVIVEPSPSPTRPLFEARFNALSLHVFHTETVKRKILNYYVRDRNMFSLLYKFVLWWLGQFHLVHRMLRVVYASVPDSSFRQYFDLYKPDAIFLPNMISNEDYRLIKEARRRNILTVGMPKSWDNLTTKTFFNILPDWVIVQNKLMYEEVQQYFEVPKEKISIVGYPQFDIYTKTNIFQTREEFCEKLGLDPRRKIIVYAAAGHELAPDDEDSLRLLIERIDARPQLRDSVQILVRPHPKYNFRAEEFREVPNLIIDMPGVLTGPKRGSWEFEDADIVHLMNTLRHADVLVNTFSTLNLEGAYFDTPLISIAFDGKNARDPRNSVSRYLGYNHIAPLVQSGGMWVARSPDELLRGIERYLGDPTSDQKGRKRIVAELLWRTGESGKLVANYILGKVGV